MLRDVLQTDRQIKVKWRGHSLSRSCKFSWNKSSCFDSRHSCMKHKLQLFTRTDGSMPAGISSLKSNRFYQVYLWIYYLILIVYHHWEHLYWCTRVFPCMYDLVMSHVCHCKAFIAVLFLHRQGRGRWEHACDPVWLHHALGLLDQHPKEGPQPALPDGLWMQGKVVEDCLCTCGLSLRVSPGVQNQT